MDPDFESVRGLCSAELPYTNNTCSSSIRLYNVSNITSDTMEEIKEVACHEYFHAIQNAYNYHNSWFKEACATWAANEIYDPIKYEDGNVITTPLMMNKMNQFIEYETGNSIFSTNMYGAAIFPLTIEKLYGGYSAILSIYEEYINYGSSLTFSQLKNVITAGIISNGYSNGNFDKAFLAMSAYLNEPNKHLSSVSNANFVNIFPGEKFENFNSNILGDSYIINPYANSYYLVSLASLDTANLTFNFCFDYTGVVVQIYTLNVYGQEIITEYIVSDSYLSIELNDVGSDVDAIYITITNINESIEIAYNYYLTYIHTHNHNASATSTGPLNHNCICSCGYSYTEMHNFMPFKAGNKCKDCGYYTTGPIIETQRIPSVEEE